MAARGLENGMGGGGLGEWDGGGGGLGECCWLCPWLLLNVSVT